MLGISLYSPISLAQHNYESLHDDVFGTSPVSEYITIPFYIEKSRYGMAEVYVYDDKLVSVKLSNIISDLESRISQDLLQSFKHYINVDQHVKVKQLRESGLQVEYDPLYIVLNITIPADLRSVSDISLYRQYDIGKREVFEPEGVSAYVNFRGNVDYNHQGVSEGIQPFRLHSEGALNVHNWVIETEANYLEDDNRPFELENVRLVHDYIDKSSRLSIGHLNYPITGFQRFRALSGVSYSRNYADIQPYKVTESTGDTSFFLRDQSEVDVIINGVKVRELDLVSGSYDIRDFPVTNGVNDVTLIITDRTGRREERQFFVINENDLLKHGLHEYAYSVGIATDGVNRRKDYATNLAGFSGFHRYGFSNELTLGLNAQGSKNQELLGFDWLLGTKYGVLQNNLALSHIDGFDMDYSIRLQHRYNFENEDQKRRSISTILTYTGKEFARFGELTPNNRFALDGTVIYSQPLTDSSNMRFSYRYRMGRDTQKDEWSIDTGLSTF